MNKDLYNTLNVDRKASKEEIRKAYLKKIKENRSTTSPDQKQFENIQKAYKVLFDDESRQLYDRTGSTETEQENHRFQHAQQPNDNAFIQHIFQQFFSQSMQEEPEPEILEVTIRLSLKESLLGFRKEIFYKRIKSCPKCGFGLFFCSFCNNEKLVLMNDQFVLSTKKFCFNSKINVEKRGNYIHEHGRFYVGPLLIQIESENTFQDNSSFVRFDKMNNRLFHKEKITRKTLNDERAVLKLFNSKNFLLKKISYQILNENKTRFILKNLESYTYILEIELL